MNIESTRDYCISLKGVTEEQPFGPQAAVYKVMGKMFALLSLTEHRRISLKNTPEKNIEIRAAHDYIVGAWHMNKKHWSMINLDEAHDQNLLIELIDDSYRLVVDKLTKKQKEALAEI